MLRKIKPYILFISKWLLVPLFLGILGQYLEGPPTRLVVRSGTFVFFCLSMSLFASHYLHQFKGVHPSVYATQGLLVPTGYIYIAQHFYNGGKNINFGIPLLFFTLLMTFNGLVFIRSLFSLYKTKSRVIRAHEVTLYTQSSDLKKGKVVFHKKSNGELLDIILVEGYSRMLSIDLKKYWHEISLHHLEQYTTTLKTHETIVKFGQTQQLVDEYEIIFNITYK